jgi:FKBP-type peptidyl-prolyl cis-trans isomerase SlpA
MSQAKKNDTVKVHYTGKLTSGEVFDSSKERDPLEFKVGSGQLIPGFDQAVEGMEINEKKTINIPSEKAYGASNPDLIRNVSQEQLPENIEPEVGQTLIASGPEGQETRLVVTEVHDEHIVVDANHPLAGKDLVFDLELVDINS